jgi:hypothetical protein
MASNNVTKKKMLALCGVLGDTSSYVHDWLTEQPAAKEESLTDWLLFDISKKSPVVRYLRIPPQAGPRFRRMAVQQSA